MDCKITTEDILGFLTPEQKIAAQLLSNSCVSAGAGSGKTRVLATRYVYLVAKYGFKPSEILTLTFTNKAAAEMYKRIFESLLEFETKIEAGQAKINLQEAIKTFSEAKIQTLDSYCSSIIRSSVHHYGIPPTYSIDQIEIENAVQKKSLEFLLSNRDNTYLQRFLGTSKTSDFARNFFAKTILQFSTIVNSIDFEKNIQNQISENNKTFEKNVNAINDLSDSLQAYIDEGNPISEKTLPLAKEFLKSSFCCPTKISPDVLDNSFWKWLNAFYEFINATKPKTSLAEILESGRQIYGKMASVTNFLVNQENLLGISPLFQQFQDLVQNTKRSLGLLTYADAADLAIKTLLDYPEIRQIEKQSYKAIMVDEFQDDNILQKKLLYLISEKQDLNNQTIPNVCDLEPEKLFFVGDEKQSIYRFRGADVEVFRHLSTELSKSATLSTNFRSSAALIASFNSIFGGEDYLAASISQTTTNNANIAHSSVFDNKITELYEASYENTKASSEKLAVAKYFPQQVHIALVPKIEDKIKNFDSTEMQAIYVAKKIKHLIDAENANPTDIAILFRSKSNQAVYERFLRQFSIPYMSEVPTSFFNDAPVNDILAFLKLSVFPRDYISFFTILKSPFVRLDEQTAIELVAICRNLDEQNPEKEESLLKLIDTNSLSNKSKERFLQFYEQYTELILFMKNNTIAKSISKIWHEFGYVFETMWNHNVEAYAEFFDYLFAMAAKADSQGQTISDFIDFLENAKEDNNKLRDIKVPLERKSAVQIMSIHASKGLEFSYVFIPEIANAGKTEYNSEETFFSEKHGVVINLPICKKIPNKKKSIVNLFYDEEKTLNENRSKAEIKRLLYVAITRAEKEVFLVGKIADKKGGGGKLSFFALLEPLIKEYTKESSFKDTEIKESKTKTNNTTENWIESFGNTKENSPFLEELIPQLTRDELKPVLMGRQNTSVERASIAKDLISEYKEACVIETPIIESNYRKPSQTHLDSSQQHSTNEIVLYPVDALFKEKTPKNDISNKEQTSSNEGFCEADFGTVAHAFIETLFLKEELLIPAKVLCKLTEKESLIVQNDAKQVAQMFFNSQLGKLAQKSSYIKNEYDFKLGLKKENTVLIVDGQIDLLFFDNETKTLFVVDFKTDKKEIPENHYLQLAIYTKAVESFGKFLDAKEIKTMLYYLRTGNIVDISKEVGKIDLESEVK